MKITLLARYRLLGSVFAVMLVLVALQMVRIQTNAKTINEINESNRYTTKTLYPERGSIYDRWGHLLAGNVEVYELGVDLRYVQNAETIAATLNSILGLDYSDTLAKVTQEYDPTTNAFVVLHNFVSNEKIEEIARLKKKYQDQAAESKEAILPSLAGLQWNAHLKRSYPEKTLASNILGFYKFLDRQEGAGFLGVEGKYNDLLAGTPRQVKVPLDPYLAEELPTVPAGSSLILTIDREIQSMVEKVLDEAVKDNGAENGVIIVSDPNTGEILAMATTPRLDPNEYWNYGEMFERATDFNAAIGDNYEPGSVFKVLTMASALDAGAVTPTTPFLDTGSIEVGGINIYNWDRGAWGPQDMTGCMQHSLNVCLSWVAVQLGPTRFYDYMEAFGIGRRTNIDLSGEILWPLFRPGDKDWYQVNLATNSFGQGLSVTPIQMVMAVGALANEGKMMAPHVLRAVIDEKRQYNNSPQIVGQPISTKAANEITEMLANSLEQEASNALVEGYRVAGKTGTGEIATPEGYTTGLTNASFVGWGPVGDVKFLVYVWLEKPQSSIWGSIVAAPVFSEVVQNLVVLMNIPPAGAVQ